MRKNCDVISCRLFMIVSLLLRDAVHFMLPAQSQSVECAVLGNNRVYTYRCVPPCYTCRCVFLCYFHTDFKLTESVGCISLWELGVPESVGAILQTAWVADYEWIEASCQRGCLLLLCKTRATITHRLLEDQLRPPEDPYRLCCTAQSSLMVQPSLLY